MSLHKVLGKGARPLGQPSSSFQIFTGVHMILTFLKQLFHYFYISEHFHVPCCSSQHLKFTHSELTQPQGRPDLIDQSGSLPTSFEVENIWWELRQTRVSNPPSLLRKYEMGPWMDVFHNSKLLVYIFRKCLLYIFYWE